MPPQAWGPKIRLECHFSRRGRFPPILGSGRPTTAASSAIAPPGDEPSTEERPHVLHRWLSLSQAQYVRYLHRRLVLSRRGLRLAEILLLGEASWSRLETGLPRMFRPGIFKGGPLPKRPPPTPSLVCADPTCPKECQFLPEHHAERKPCLVGCVRPRGHPLQCACANVFLRAPKPPPPVPPWAARQTRR